MSGTTYRDTARLELFGGPVDTITLTLPARSEFVALARTVVAAAAARLEMPYDEVDDVRLAADEAVGHLVITSTGPDAILEVQVMTSGEAIEVTASIDHIPADWPPSAPQELLTWQILTGLVDAARFDTIGERAVISFTKTVNARSSA